MALAVIIVVVLATLLVIASGAWVALGLIAALLAPRPEASTQADRDGGEAEQLLGPSPSPSDLRLPPDGGKTDDRSAESDCVS